MTTCQFYKSQDIFVKCTDFHKFGCYKLSISRTISFMLPVITKAFTKYIWNVCEFGYRALDLIIWLHEQNVINVHKYIALIRNIPIV